MAIKKIFLIYIHIIVMLRCFVCIFELSPYFWETNPTFKVSVVKKIYWKHLLLDVNKVVIMLLLFSILLMIMTYKMSNVQKTPPRYNSTWSIYGSITHKQAAASSTREVYIRYSLKLCNQNPSMWVRVVNIYFIVFI